MAVAESGIDAVNAAAVSEPATVARIALVGNPNVGKSLLFGLLTRTYVTVSNYPGTTVEIRRGALRRGLQSAEVIDTPGVNTLVPTSEDERVTRDILLEDSPGSVLQVGDAKNLRRVLLVTAELAEMGVPLSLCLNMEDEAARAGVWIDARELSRILAVPCVATVAVRRKGLAELVASLSATAVPFLPVEYPEEVESAVRDIEGLLPDDGVHPRALALMLLGGDETLTDWLHRTVGPRDVRRIREVRENLRSRGGESIRWVIQRARLAAVDAIVSRVQRNGNPRDSQVGRSLAWATTHPVWGVPILLAVLTAVFAFVGWLGAGIGVNFLENMVFGAWLNPVFERLFAAVPSPFIRDLFVGPYGLISMGLTYAVAIILPVVVTFFLAFGALEDSGYLPRLAVIVNRIFRAMGLNGKAVLPMVLGLGCDTMATLTTRILETRKERVIVTLLLALAVPCSAQLGVIVGLLAGLSWVVTVLWVGLVLGILVGVGWLSAKLLPGQASDFILELPPLRWPRPGNLLAKTLGRVEWYVKEAVPLFLVGTLVLFVADRLNLLSAAERIGEPVVVTLLDLPPEAAAIFLMGFLRRDFGAAGLFAMSQAGALTELQVLVALVVITLFIPCIANFLMIIKEQGWRTATAMALFIFPFALFVGTVVNHGLRALGFGS
jgi:ferrous iron transport protein B